MVLGLLLCVEKESQAGCGLAKQQGKLLQSLKRLR
jgi:hypothetical protein